MVVVLTTMMNSMPAISPGLSDLDITHLLSPFVVDV